MNIKKLFATLAGVSLFAQTVIVAPGALAAEYSQELQDAYNWAYSKGVTTMSSIDNANMYGKITRAEMAKMLSVYAMEVLGYTPDTSKACNFTDIASVKGDLYDFIIKSCQLGIMGQGISNFRPYDTITRAEFGTALSRTLWDKQYEGGTPYYAKHLNALKAAGIMTQIENAESRLEVRGYVMLMLMRSDDGKTPSTKADCNDPVVRAACLLDADECPAECRDENSKAEDNINDKVKSGSLVVEADDATGRSAIKGAASDLDTLTFKTSEEVEITKVELERYGYSSPDDIDAVRLENSDGTIVAEEKSVNSKDKVTLSIKKDYRKVDGTEEWTIVVRLKDEAVVKGSTIGFKVTDVTSTAKDVDLGNYKPFLYDIVTYDQVSVTLNDKGSEKDYNYEEGESYEVAKLKVKAGSSALEVNGFTLTNVYYKGAAGNKNLDLEDFLDKVSVTADGKKLDGVKYTIDDDELTVSFDSYEIEAKGSTIFAVSISLKDFDEYGEGVEFVVAKSSDAKMTEKKTGARVSVELPHGNSEDHAVMANAWKDAHAFLGSKIKLSGKKLGSVDASQGSEDIIVLDGEIEIAESIDKFTFTVTAKYENLSGDAKEVEPIDEMRLLIAGDEYTASKKGWTAGATTATSEFTFSNVEIEDAGEFQIVIDVDSDATQAATVTLTSNGSSISSKTFDGTNARYSEARKYVQPSEVKGSISFATKVTIQPSKASLSNDLTKRVEFTKNDSSSKTVFEGNYTAKKGDVYLNTVSIISSTGHAFDSDATFYVYIDGDEVATLDVDEEDTFSDVLVKAGESVKVVVKAEINSDKTSSEVAQYTLKLSGDDDNGNENAGNASKRLVDIKVVEKGTFTITDTSTAKDTVLLRAKDTLAQFTIKPSNNNEGLTLEEIYLTGTFDDGTPITADDISFRIDGVEYMATEGSYTTGILYEINEEVPSKGYTATIDLEEEVAGKVEIKVAEMNGLKQTKTFKKSFAEGLVYIDSQKNEKDFTQYYLGIELFDDAYTVKNVKFGTGQGATCDGFLSTEGLAEEPSDGDDFTIDNGNSTQSIRCISYEVYNEEGNLIKEYNFNNKDFPGYFKVPDSGMEGRGDQWRVYSND